MTWNQLNHATDGGISDMLGIFADDLLEPYGDEDIWQCDVLDQIKFVLDEIYHDMPADHDAEMVENRRLRRDLDLATQ